MVRIRSGPLGRDPTIQGKGGGGAAALCRRAAVHGRKFAGVAVLALRNSIRLGLWSRSLRERPRSDLEGRVCEMEAR